MLSSKQNKCITNMLGYGYEIIYKKGKTIVMAKDLSRKYKRIFMFFILTNSRLACRGLIGIVSY
jgi:hypothetical protein